MRIERGATRVVVVGKRYVFKLPHFDHWYGLIAGLLSNMNESAIWKERRDDPRLCPIVVALPGGWMNVMRRAEPIAPKDIDHHQFTDITLDVDSSNFGRYEGRVVLIDYA